MVRKAESGPEISQIGGRETVGQMASSVPKCSKLRTLLSLLLFYTMSELRKKQGSVRVIPGFTCGISLINFTLFMSLICCLLQIEPLTWCSLQNSWVSIRKCELIKGKFLVYVV